MRYVCLGYMEESLWDQMSQDDRKATLAECHAYDEELERSGHFVGGEVLPSVRVATSLRYRDGQVSVTDGPFAETKEQLGGLIFLEAKDLDEAIRLMSNHPSLKRGTCWEVRPGVELDGLFGG